MDHEPANGATIQGRSCVAGSVSLVLTNAVGDAGNAMFFEWTQDLLVRIGNMLSIIGFLKNQNIQWIRNEFHLRCNRMSFRVHAPSNAFDSCILLKIHQRLPKYLRLHEILNARSKSGFINRPIKPVPNLAKGEQSFVAGALAGDLRFQSRWLFQTVWFRI